MLDTSMENQIIPPTQPSRDVREDVETTIDTPLPLRRHDLDLPDDSTELAEAANG